MSEALEIRDNFLSFLSNHPEAEEFILLLEEHANLILFGGSVRDYKEHKFTKIPRDFDIVLSNNNFDIEKIIPRSLGSTKCKIDENKFGGYKIQISNLNFDIWDIQKTWAFQEEKVYYNSFKDLDKTVFLNIDRIFYNLSTGMLYDEGFQETIDNKELDIVLEDNPYPALNLARALRFKAKYELSFSSNLKSFFYSWVRKFENDKEALNVLKEIEWKRYKSSYVEKEWNNIMDTRISLTNNESRMLHLNLV